MQRKLTNRIPKFSNSLINYLSARSSLAPASFAYSEMLCQFGNVKFCPLTSFSQILLDLC
jgi:hypothetical protein